MVNPRRKMKTPQARYRTEIMTVYEDAIAAAPIPETVTCFYDPGSRKFRALRRRRLLWRLCPTSSAPR
jgi:hypothetical protein